MIKKLVIFSGRFQPVHSGHYSVYKHLVDKFGTSDVYIATSNKIESGRSPLSFNEKKTIWTSMFSVPPSKVIQVRNPYNPIEITKKFDKSNTVLIVAVSQKDGDRLTVGKFYKPLNKTTNLKPFGDDEGYFEVVPTFQMNINGKNVSGTQIRAIMTGSEVNDDIKQKIFKKIYGKFNKKIFDMLKSKLNESCILQERVSMRHIEDLKPKELLDFLRLWNADKEDIIMTEKVDGQYFGFGLKDGKYFSKSNSITSYKDTDYPSLYMFMNFQRFHREMQKLPIKQESKRIIESYKIPFNNNILIEGEMVASFDANVVIYDPQIIGDGIYVIFRINIDGTEYVNPDMINDFTKAFNKSSIKFHSAPNLNIKHLDFKETYQIRLRQMIEKYGNILSKPARKPHEKIIKAKILNVINMIAARVKDDFLQADFSGNFGKELEGVVIELPGGKRFKIVDKDKFLTAKNTQWYYLTKLIELERGFARSIKSEPENIDKYLKNFRYATTSIAKEFRQQGRDKVTLAKKYNDTRQHIALVNKRIKQMEAMLKKSSANQVTKMYLSKKILGESIILIEGGNIFSQSNSAVKKEFADSTIKLALSSVGLSDIKKYELMGNRFAKISGDIDIGINGEDVANITGFDQDYVKNKKEFWDKLELYLKKNSKTPYKLIRGLQNMAILVPLIDKSGKQQKAIDRQENIVADQAFVQIDVFVGNLNFMKQSMRVQDKNTEYKDIYYRRFLANILSVVKHKIKGSDVQIKLHIHNPTGIQMRWFKEKPNGKRDDLSTKTISTNFNDLTEYLFGKKYSSVNTFEKMWKEFNSSSFKFSSQRTKIIKAFEDDMNKAGLPLPKEIK